MGAAHTWSVRALLERGGSSSLEEDVTSLLARLETLGVLEGVRLVECVGIECCTFPPSLSSRASLWEPPEMVFFAAMGAATCTFSLPALDCGVLAGWGWAAVFGVEALLRLLPTCRSCGDFVGREVGVRGLGYRLWRVGCAPWM
jgi:hypothetical protein